MGVREMQANWKWWLTGSVLAVGLVSAVALFVTRGTGAAVTAGETGGASPRSAGIRVEVVYPRKGALEQTTTQPGSVHAFESVQMYAGVSGYLKTQTVDIGDRVQRGQTLATVDVPELDKQVQRYRSDVERARARVLQMQARVISAKADLEAARAAVPQAEANAKSKAAELRFREKQLLRMKDLLALKSVDERLVDEKTEQRDAAWEAEISAREGVNSARARVAATSAKVEQADADVVEAAASVKVAQAELEKAEAIVRFATIVAPFDGVVTQRNFYVGDFVRSASEGTHLPLLTVQRTDLMRVVVQIPDRDVPFADPGDPAVIEIDALPGKKLTAKVARIAQSEDAATRLMHVEIDLPNPSGKIRSGMYGRVTIILDNSDHLAVPCACLVGKPQEGKGSVYVVRDGRACLVPIRIAGDNGLQVGVLSGLTAKDAVVVHPATTLRDGVPVSEALAGPAAGAAPAH